jgi:hypothetical protein
MFAKPTSPISQQRVAGTLRELENKKMNYNLGQQTRKTALVRSLLTAALVIACAFGTVSSAAAQKVTPPATPAKIAPPAGNSAFMVGHAVGTQGYVCLPKGTGASWTVIGARPEATLFEGRAGLGRQITTHFLSPNANPNQNAPNPLPFGNATWQSSIDSSKVWAKPVDSIAAGSDASSCPNTGAIDCLLLGAVGTQQGPTGGKFLAKTTFIQRLNTRGGSAPADNAGCSAATDVGHQLLVPYTADYYFFRRAE